MNPIIKTYQTKEHETVAVFIVPGYTDGLSNPLLSHLSSVLVEVPGLSEYGLDFSYTTQDEENHYEEKISLMIDAIRSYQELHPRNKVIVVGKSLGAALAMVMAYEHPGLIAGLVVLGYPARLGWPARPSLLGSTDGDESAFAEEWKPILAGLALPVLFINGSDDSLMDFEFLQQQAELNRNLLLHTIIGGSHGLSVTGSEEGYEQAQKLTADFITRNF